MKPHFRIFFLLLLIPFWGISQDFPGSVTFFDLKNKIKTFKRSVVSIETVDEKADFFKTNTTLLGSGFLTIKSGTKYIVTNHHVIANIPAGYLLLVGVNLNEGKAYLIAKVLKSDSQKDIAILELTTEFLARFKVSSADLKLAQSAVGISFFAESDNIQEGESALIIGYPLGIGSDVNENKPVARIGIVAQSVSSDGTFLLDATANPGNSGSPVFNLQTEKLIGMIFAYRNDYSRVIDKNNNSIANVSFNSGISLCISAADILRLLP